MEKNAQHTPTAGFIYVRSEHELWTVGTYASGKWAPESDHGSPDAAAARVHYLNGGNPAHDELVAALRMICDSGVALAQPIEKAMCAALAKAGA